jgi:hypothetical protein
MNTGEYRIFDSFCNNYPSDCSLDHTKLNWTNKASANIQGPRGTPVVVDLEYSFEFVTPLGGILQLIGGNNLANPTIKAHSSMRLE